VLRRTLELGWCTGGQTLAETERRDVRGAFHGRLRWDTIRAYTATSCPNGVRTPAP
jgi:hypothetical protein